MVRKFRKVLIKHPQSIFFITQKQNNIFKSNQSQRNTNSIVYNFYVLSKVQNKTEICGNDAGARNWESCHWAARLASQGYSPWRAIPVATRHQHASHSPRECWQFAENSVFVKNPFSPQNPNFQLPNAQIDSKVYPNVFRHEKILKIIYKLESNINLNKITIWPIFSKQQQHLIFHQQPMNMYTMVHSQ